MATRAGDDPIFDTHDTQLLDALSRAKLLSTSQLQRIVGHREPMGTLVERLARLAQGGWLVCLPRVNGPAGSVAAWHRADLHLRGDAHALAGELIHLNELYAALCAGPRAMLWDVELGDKPEAVLVVPGHRTWRLSWATDRANTPKRLELESLVLCADPELRDRLENEGVRAATLDEGIHVLRALIHGEELVAPGAEPIMLEVSDADREEIARFLEEQLN